MTPQLLQTAQWMTANARTVRYRPVTGLPPAERFSQVERLVDALWDLARDLGVNIGPKPAIVYRGDAINPSTALSGLTALQIEVLATYLMLGLGDTFSRGVYEFVNRKPATPSPNYRVIVDETYAEEEADQVFQD